MNRRKFIVASSAAALLPSVSSAVEKKKPPIKIGQIGTGHAHASGKMEVYRKSGDFDVVGIAESGTAHNAYAGLTQMTVADLLAVPGLQAVAVETEVGDLLRFARMAVGAGKHVHLDKPAGENMQKYKDLMAAAYASNLTVQMGYMYRYNPAVILLRKFLDKGWLGDVFEVHAVMSKVVPPGSRKQLAQFKGGIMFELGCHIIDLVVSVLGKPEKVTGHHRSHGDDGLVDNMLAVFDYPSATATVRSTALEVEGFARRHLTVCGTKGTFHIQPLDRPTVTLSLDHDCDGAFQKGTQEIPFNPPYERYVGDAADFAAIIRGEKLSDFPPAHDLAVQQSVLEACS